MLKRFVQWLDDVLADEGASAVVKAVLGVMSFAVLLGAVLGNAAVKAGALVTAVLVALSLGLLLLSDRKGLLRQVEMYRKLVSHYSKIVADDRHPSYRVITWDEFVSVEPSGDARRQVTIRAKVLSKDMWVLRMVHGCGWPQPAKYRGKVDVRVRKLLVGDLPGASLTTTSAWLADGKLALIVHFPVPPREGSEISIVVECSWPGMCLPLMRERAPDEFTISFATPVVYARYRVALPAGYDAYLEPIGFGEDEDGFASGPGSGDNGRPVFLFEAFDVPMHHKVGMRLEIKR